MGGQVPCPCAHVGVGLKINVIRGLFMTSCLKPRIVFFGGGHDVVLIVMCDAALVQSSRFSAHLNFADYSVFSCSIIFCV